MEALELQQQRVPSSGQFPEFLSSNACHGSQSPLYSGEVDVLMSDLNPTCEGHDNIDNRQETCMSVRNLNSNPRAYDLELKEAKQTKSLTKVQSAEPSPVASDVNNANIINGNAFSCSRCGSQRKSCRHHVERPASLVSSSASISQGGSRVCSTGPPSCTPPGGDLAWGTFCPNCQLSLDTLENLTCDNCSSSTFSAADLHGQIATPVREDSATLSLSDPSQDKASSSTDISSYVNRSQQYPWTGQENGHAVTMATCSLMVTMDNGNGPVHTHAHRGDDKVVYARPRELVAASVLLILPAPPCGLAALYFAVRACQCHKNGRFEDVSKFSRGVLYCCCMGLVFFVALLVAMIARFHMTYNSIPAGLQEFPDLGDIAVVDVNDTSWIQPSNSSESIFQETIQVPFDPQQLFKPGLGIPTNLTEGEKLDELLRQVRSNNSLLTS